MAKTRKRQIKQRGGEPCLFVLGSIIDSIETLINTVGKIKKKTEIEKINKINNDLSNFIETAFNKQINTTCTDIKKSDYDSLIKHLTRLSEKFKEKQEVFSVDTQGYLTRIETMKTKASELSKSIIEPLPNPPQIKSKTVKKKTSPKVVKTTDVMPPLPHMLPPTLMKPPVAAATVEEKAAKEAQKNAEKKARRATRKAYEDAIKAAEDAAIEEATRKKNAKIIADEAASKIAAKNANKAVKEEAIKVAN